MSRIYLNSNRIEQLAHDLSAKEVSVLDALAQVRIASADQLERWVFFTDSARYRRQVLQSMTERGLLARLDRTVGGRRSGSSTYIYVLSVGGLRILGSNSAGRVRQPTTPGPPFVRHALAVTELAVRLHEVQRQGLVEVLDFQAEPTCWRPFPGPGGGTEFCKPDGYARIGIGNYEDHWFLEVDLGTESATALERQLTRYRRLWASGTEQSRRGIFPRVLWLVPDQRRYQVLVDACGRQPAESWQLHRVSLFENAIPLMTEGTS